LETELQPLRQVVDTAIDYMHIRGKCLEEHLLDVFERVRDVVEYSVHRGVAVALAAA
jgi:hypothetical protein